MNRKVMLLLIFLIGIAVCGAIVIHEFFPHIYAIKTSIGEINSDPSGWVNKMVVVEGKLVGPMGFAGASAPWNYELFGSNETVETIGKKETVSMGVLWNSQDDYSFENTRVVGVVREGWLYLHGEQLVCYYVEAKKIDSL